MKYDDYGEVINAPETYQEIADTLKRMNVLIGWTDGEGTHLDILFTAKADGFGTFQGGVKDTDLFVSIMRMGAFGFEKEKDDTHAGYYEEKLGDRLGSTADALAQLINGIKKLLK